VRVCPRTRLTAFSFSPTVQGGALFVCYARSRFGRYYGGIGYVAMARCERGPSVALRPRGWG
jgi:hypothetical protein